MTWSESNLVNDRSNIYSPLMTGLPPASFQVSKDIVRKLFGGGRREGSLTGVGHHLAYNICGNTPTSSIQFPPEFSGYFRDYWGGFEKGRLRRFRVVQKVRTLELGKYFF